MLKTLNILNLIQFPAIAPESTIKPYYYHRLGNKNSICNTSVRALVYFVTDPSGLNPGLVLTNLRNILPPQLGETILSHFSWLVCIAGLLTLTHRIRNWMWFVMDRVGLLKKPGQSSGAFLWHFLSTFYIYQCSILCLSLNLKWMFTLISQWRLVAFHFIS